ncbi:hypothetical protein [Tenacibaculum piscium]|uniref:Uncharacterized protein n=2 Tax=Tenacibaculum piscium TaxID=1458515 RepID=A0A2H1YKK6_9FLAO|nr:hypothetical protein [Tenacibaculum piscium]MBE7629176.1 hypothetical protein [Tenacibaculum piscium]MBE7669963.1 hypothetical protein [Tenacibaculum piscium]MBE7685614.1 hypothetical protein [Tenacibaculum piscium]MBE7690198.1 hypothetical protein [Tenacibaculum piscium]SOS76032.1 conserved hypothetical protein [Tenacibaculum piscium]
MHKKLASDLTSLAHSILQMKNKEDVFALKQKAHEVYEKISVLAYVEEYINNTPNPSKTKQELLQDVLVASQNKERHENTNLSLTKKNTAIYQLEEEQEVFQKVEDTIAKVVPEIFIDEVQIQKNIPELIKVVENKISEEKITEKTQEEIQEELEKEVVEKVDEEISEEKITTIIPEIQTEKEEILNNVILQKSEEKITEKTQEEIQEEIQEKSEKEVVEKVDEKIINKEEEKFNEAIQREFNEILKTKKLENEQEKIVPISLKQALKNKIEQEKLENKSEEKSEEKDKKDFPEIIRKTLEDELQGTISVDVMADLFEKITPKKSLNDFLQKAIQIDLNDRIVFVRHLFDGNQNDFNRVVSQLNTFKTESEAKRFITEMIKPDYNWSGKEIHEARLFEIIERRFA